MKVGGLGKVNIDLVFSGFPRWLEEGEELYSKGFEMLLGGGYPATLINLFRLGTETVLVTWLGKDVFSRFGEAELARYGVKPVNLYDGTGIPVNVTSVMLTPGERTMASFTDAVDIDNERAYAALKGSDIVLMDARIGLDLYKRLKAEGAVIVLDTGYDDQMSLEKYASYFEVADYYLPNSREAMKVTGTESAEEALIVLSRYFKRAVVKRDKCGAICAENGKRYLVKSIEEFVNVDSTGAGDAFMAGFTYGLTKGLSLPECVLAGNVTGGKCVTEIGCLKGYENEKELLEYLKKYSGNILPE